MDAAPFFKQLLHSVQFNGFRKICLAREIGSGIGKMIIFLQKAVKHKLT